jgi:hypothetical protein
MANEHRLSWVNPAQRADGSALAPADIGGYTVTIDGTVRVSLSGSATTADLSKEPAYQALKPGAHTATVAVIDKHGVSSAQSAPVTFTVAAVPNAPTGVSIS